MLTWRLHRLHKLTDQESQRRYPQDTGLSLSDGRCLGAIGAFAPLSVKQLAQRANLTKGQASRAAQCLFEKGLIRKDDQADDGRGVSLSLTPAGRRTWRRIMDLITRRNEEIFGCLDATERQRFSELVDRLLACSESAAAQSSESPE